jgi:hypothetical protein
MADSILNTPEQQAAIEAYWAARTPQDERDAYVRMMAAGLPNQSYIDGARNGARLEWRRMHPDGVPCDGCMTDCARLLDAYTALLDAAING